MTPHEFIQKWQAVTLSERSACQQHFLDLCDLLGQPKPAAADPEGAWYTFERGVAKTEGGNGWADVWMRGHFGWEYKGKHKDLAAAYKQLNLYREALENPPLLVVCDLDRFEIHTNFTGTVKRVHAFDLTGLVEPANLDILRRVFTDPESLRPGQTTEGVTKQAAELIGQIADGMRVRGIPAHDAAHFLMKLMFSMFAEDIDLLKNKVFRGILKSSKDKPAVLAQRMQALFEAMSTGGYFGADEVLHFNGGLFADAAVIELRPDEIRNLVDANNRDWSSVEPSIFGTLFERTLNPEKLAQVGTHYTSRADIETILEPVVMHPLRREWDAVKAECEELWKKMPATARKRGHTTPVTRRKAMPKRITEASKTAAKIEKRLQKFIERLESATVLDPACGSGNFLYVALHLLLDLNKEVISYAAQRGIHLFPAVRPTQLLGIEKDEYAQELASVVIWIGYLQWMHDNGFTPQLDPVLEPFESIHRMDAILDLSDPESPREPEWPPAEFIVGNPPFLGDKKMKGGLGSEYVNALREIYTDRICGGADLVTFWFEKARAAIEANASRRAGLIATQSIRAGANRSVLERIKKSGDIFAAWSDRPWVIEGAAVRVSLVCFDNGIERLRKLDDRAVPEINANLSAMADITKAQRLSANMNISFVGDQKTGKFEVGEDVALQMLSEPTNVNGCPNSDVIRPWINGSHVTGRQRQMWIVDFPLNSAEDAASRYEMPFNYIREHVYPERARNTERTLREKYWIHARPRPEMRDAIGDSTRFFVTPRVAKHRMFAWFTSVTVPDSRLFVFSTGTDYLFGVLHSRIHEVWSLATSPRHGVGNDPTYNAMSCFETFPFPEPTDAQREAIAAAAKELDTLRNNWLNPPEWTRTEILEFPGSTDGPWRRYIDPASVDVSLRETNPHAEREDYTIGTVHYPRIVPQDEECAKQLKKRTLTNLYNERPTWLDLAHKKLDAAVFAAYGWDPTMSDEDLLAALLALNLARAQSVGRPESLKHAL